jgi:heat shock protein beta
VELQLCPAVPLVVQTFGEFLDPLAHVHFNVEGTIEFTSVLFVPGMAPFEQQNWSAKSRSIKLYVRRVFISDEFDEDLMPRWASRQLCPQCCWKHGPC